MAEIIIPTKKCFGGGLKVVTSEELSTTTMTEWQDKLELAAPECPGEYNLIGYTEIRNNNVDGKTRVRIIEGGSETVIVEVLRNFPADDNEDIVSGTIPLIVAGTETSYKIQFCRAGVLCTVGIYRARLQLWRIK